MSTTFHLPLRWHLRALGSNPLIRRSDRLEALVFLGVLVVALLAIPFATNIGRQTFDGYMQTVSEQADTRHSIEATVLDGSTSVLTDFEGPTPVRVQWPEGDELRTEYVFSPGIVKAGDSMTIWVDDEGKVVTAPHTATDAQVSAIGAGMTIWISVVAFGAMAAFGVRRGLDRSRDRGWDREVDAIRAAGRESL